MVSRRERRSVIDGQFPPRLIEMTLGRQFKVGINRRIFGKADPSKVNLATGWENESVTSTQLIESIRAGCAFSAHFKDGYRKSTNFICSDVVAADVDGNFTIDEACRLPFVQEHAAFLYTTPSHTEERHRFRSRIPPGRNDPAVRNVG